jgi:uncharacterized protein
VNLFSVRQLLVILFAALMFAGGCFAQAPAAPVAATTASLDGDWSGSLQAGEAQLHLALHVSKARDGSLKATLDSLDQGVYGIEASSLQRSGAALKFEVSSVGAKFAGIVSADHKIINGEWSQDGAALPLVFHRQAPGVGSRKPSDAVAAVEGVWQGAFETSGMRFRLRLHVSHDAQGQLVAGLDSLDQGVEGLPATNVSLEESAFHFEIPAAGGLYEGVLSAGKNMLAGSWTQAGPAMKLDFKRSDQVLDLLRPQNPVKPYPYLEEQVTFSNARVTLAGTLTIPHGQGPFAAALLISGSGPLDRDEALAGHRPFFVLAAYLTRKGIAVLRYDKRGNADSSGNYADATTEDFTADAEAAISYLKSRKEIDAKKIGIIGHSEGGIIAPKIAAHSDDVAWIVLLAGPATKGEDTLLQQSELVARAAGMEDEQVARSIEFDRKAYALVRQAKDRATLESKLNELVQESGMSAAMPPAALQAQIRMLSSPWFRSFLDYDPVPALEKIKCPLLALNGEKDLQVPPKQNLSLIQKALQDAGNKDFQTRELPGLNHLFQHCQTGSPAEYGPIEETIAPEVLQAIADWLQKRTTP